MPMIPKEMIKHLKKNGFVEVAQKGSHVKLVNETTVPYHSKPLKKGLEQAILKQAGLK
ncbi:MAG: type II toxin-antitoxin system HicA family toxin [Anaerovoracaceae bacterium]